MSHYQPYPTYKDSGVEWLGEVPIHWSHLKVGRNVPFSIGWTPPTGDATSYGDDCAWVCISDLGPEIVSATAKGLSNKAMFAKGAKPLPIGTLLFSFKLTVGTVSFLGIPAVTNEAIAAFLPVKNIDLKFFYYAAPNFIPKYGRENIYGALLLNQELIQSAKSYFPPIEEQRSIAVHLDRETARIDGLVSKKTRFIELLREKRQSLITRAVTKGLDPNVRMKDSGVEWLGAVPKEWEITPVKYCLHELVDTEHKTIPFVSESEYLVVRTSNIRDGKLVLDEIKCTDSKSFEEWTRRATPKPGDIIFTREAPAGEACIVPQGLNVCLGQRTVLMRTNQDRVLPEFLLMTLYAGIAKKFIDEMSQGSIVSHFNMGEIRNLPVLLPSIEDQQAIVIFLNRETLRVDTLISKTERSIELLKERRSALITVAVTGQIDVREKTSRQEQLAA